MQRQRNGAAENCTRPVGEALSLPKCTQLSRLLNGSSFPAQTIGADRTPQRLHELKIYERIVNRMSDVGVANLATRSSRNRAPY